MSGEEDLLSGYKTYYLRILADNAVFYKFGRCAGSIKQRFSKERPDLEIEVLRMWHHKSHRSAVKHEIHLFESFPGDRPYIGRCGPFRFGGNTETFSHDVMAGEPAPHSYWVRMYSERQGCLHTRAYSGSDPRTPYRYLIGKISYLDLIDGPRSEGEGEFIQIADLSSPDAIVIATEEFLERYLDSNRPAVRWLPKRIAKDVLAFGMRLQSWDQYNKMKFWGNGFKFNWRVDDLA